MDTSLPTMNVAADVGNALANLNGQTAAALGQIASEQASIRAPRNIKFTPRPQPMASATTGINAIALAGVLACGIAAAFGGSSSGQQPAAPAKPSGSTPQPQAPTTPNPPTPPNNNTTATTAAAPVTPDNSKWILGKAGMDALADWGKAKGPNQPKILTKAMFVSRQEAEAYLTKEGADALEDGNLVLVSQILKKSKPDQYRKSVDGGILPNVDDPGSVR